MSKKLLKDFDVTLGELLQPEGHWRDVLERIRERWVGDSPDRVHNVRCGTIYVEEEQGLGKVVLHLRFPLEYK